MNLKEGDAVYTRVFDGSGENTSAEYPSRDAVVAVRINQRTGQSIATKVNQEHDDIKSGVWSENGFDPSYGVKPHIRQ
ncbi:hypothetical protein OH492_26905 [Vibrio chagasii]|nr:hypothetical protein [Vibrio chagasii]